MKDANCYKAQIKGVTIKGVTQLKGSIKGVRLDLGRKGVRLNFHDAVASRKLNQTPLLAGYVN
jgi:hypothetical protein